MDFHPKTDSDPLPLNTVQGERGPGDPTLLITLINVGWWVGYGQSRSTSVISLARRQTCIGVARDLPGTILGTSPGPGHRLEPQICSGSRISWVQPREALSTVGCACTQTKHLSVCLKHWKRKSPSTNSNRPGGLGQHRSLRSKPYHLAAAKVTTKPSLGATTL